MMPCHCSERLLEKSGLVFFVLPVHSEGRFAKFIFSFRESV